VLGWESLDCSGFGRIGLSSEVYIRLYWGGEVLVMICFTLQLYGLRCNPPRPDRLWGPPSLLSRGSFSGGKAAGA